MPTEPSSAFLQSENTLLLGPAEAPRLRVAEKPFAMLWEVGFLADPAQETLRGLAGKNWHMMRLAPRRAWLVSEREQTRPSVPVTGTVLIDQGHGRVRVSVAGSEVEAALARLVPVDLRAKSCPVGAVATTLMHHVGITMERTDTHGFDLYLPRSFARALMHEIHAAGRAVASV